MTDNPYRDHDQPTRPPNRHIQRWVFLLFFAITILALMTLWSVLNPPSRTPQPTPPQPAPSPNP